MTGMPALSGATVSATLRGMPPTLPDEELMLRYQAGDLPAFRELYQRHRQGLYRFIAWRSPRRDWVDEITQDAWAALHAARAGYRPEAQFKTWLYQIARNRLVDLLRQKELEAGEAAPEPADEATPAELLSARQQDQLLHAAIRALPAEQREALVLQQFSGLSIEEIAEVTGAERETVKSRLRYAMQKLRSALQPEGSPS
jgi:RNA polymerase sigma factor (sigma-70 family)